MNILFAGDYCDNGRASDLIREGKYNSLFSGINEIVSSYDFSAVNFEFPIVEKVGIPINKCGPALKGQPKAVDAIKYAGFKICTLANNHILDQGYDCLLNTISQLEASGIKTVGAGKNKTEAQKVLYIEKGEEKLAIINCCEHEFSICEDDKPGANPLNLISQYKSILEARNKANYVIVVVHGGIEHFPCPTLRMKELYRFFVDLGADAVINHHQHCYCGYEIYNGKPIFYGLGNLLFDWEGKRNTIWNEGAMVGISLSKNEEPQIKFYPYSQCNDVPGVFIMRDNQKKQFLEKETVIKTIIQDDNLLIAEYEKHVARQYKEYQLLVEPYKSRLTKGLFNRGLLPSMLSKTKLLKLYNYIYCESHQEVLISVLIDLIRRKK